MTVGIGLLLSIIFALDCVVIGLHQAGSHAGRNRMWYRRWAHRALGLNMLLTQATIVVVYLHVYHP